MTATSPAPHTPATWPRARGWRVLLPARTPDHLRAAARPIPGWAAYSAYILIFTACFGWSIRQIIMAGGAYTVTAPAEGEVLAAALPEWGMHAILTAFTAAVMWAVARWLRIQVRDLGVLPSWTRPPHPRRRRQFLSVFTWALAAYITSMVAQGVLAVLTASTEGGFQMTTRGEVVRMVTLIGPTQVTTAVIEEILVVAIPVVLLAAARRPAWEVYALTCAAKLSYHLYYGWPMLPLLAGAAVMVWLYRRTGRITPIIAAHAAYNLGYSCLVLAAATQLPA